MHTVVCGGLLVKRMLMGLCLGTVILSGGMIGSTPDAGLQELLKEDNLNYVREANVAQQQSEFAKIIKNFNAMRYACGAVLLGMGCFRIYDWYTGMQSLSTGERLDAQEKRVTALETALSKSAPSKLEPIGWLDSISSWSKRTFTGLPTYMVSTIVSGAAFGLLTAKIPIPELLKAEPSFGWFLTRKTGFLSECEVMGIYYQQQAVHDAFCVETVRLVEDVEKILGYIDYQISKIKKSSSMAAKVLASRRAQLISMTNKLVDLVATKQYRDMAIEVQTLNGFVQVGLISGILE